MPPRPYLLENLSDASSHAAALEYLVSDLDNRYPLAVATGFVNLGGLHHLATIVDPARGVRVLLGAVPDPALGAELPTNRFQNALALLAKERDLARFPPSRAAKQLVSIDEWLRDPNVQVRRFLTQFLHGKAYLFGTTDDARAALVTSANLTAAGLFRNLELGLVHYDPPLAELAVGWFDKLWSDAGEYKDELRRLLFPDPGIVDPETVYLRALLELYEGELTAPLPPAVISAVALAPFQRDGYERARRILSRHHGVIYADGVGTGKTEIGLAFIEEYALKRGQHALVVAPAQLVKMWQDRIHKARLPAQVVSFQQVSTDEQLVVLGGRRHLANAKDSYRLVIVDEGHALRNPDTTWYRAITRLLGGEQKDLVLLTATPVNNGLWDLYHLVMAFARHDRALAAFGIPSIRELFVKAGANERDPENLDPDVLFPLADAVSVRRDRRFIEEHYPGATFPDGTPVRFPHPNLVTVRYDLDLAHPGLFEDMTTGIASLTMARYRPSAYEVGGEEVAAEAQLGGLLQSAILKRFESCWAACLATIDHMIKAHEAFLMSWAAGRVPSRSILQQAARGELDEAGVATWLAEELEADPESRPVSDFIPEYRDSVNRDLDGLRSMRAGLARLDASSDPKLAELVRLLEDPRDKKVAVFATFGDTIRYLDQNLPAAIGRRERVVVIGSETDPDSRMGALGRFCPETVVRAGYEPPLGEVDLLLSTDVLSEGQNLQQASAVISYDMPWNPQRVVQRNGRVIRLKSPHEEVHLCTMLPEPGELDELLRLEATIRRKILAASVFGMESEVIQGIEVELRSYAERLTEGDETLLEETDQTSALGFAGEELRKVLQRAIEEGELARLRALPWGIGAAFQQGSRVPSQGANGTFFACRIASGERYWRYVESGGAETDSDAEILRRINPGTAPGLDASAGSLDLESSWRIAVESIVDAHNRRADPHATQQELGPVQRYALEVLRDPATVLPLGADKAEEALSVERSSAVRQALAEVRSLVVEGSISRTQAAQRIVGVVEAFGLQPVEAPSPMMEIEESDVGVVCWMTVFPQPLLRGEGQSLT